MLTYANKYSIEKLIGFNMVKIKCLATHTSDLEEHQLVRMLLDSLVANLMHPHVQNVQLKKNKKIYILDKHLEARVHFAKVKDN